MNFENTALIMIDLQAFTKRLAKNVAPHSFDEVIENNKKLITAFEVANRPIYFVTVEPKFLPKKWREAFGRLELADIFANTANAHKLVKSGPSAFTKSDYGLETELKSFGITELYITGISTSNGVYKTAVDGAKSGFDVVLVEDAATAPKAAAHEKIINLEFPKIGKVVKTADIL